MRPIPVQLLVSVRNVAEAESALTGGCDVLDIKEPERGALGMAEGAVIAAIADCARAFNPGLPVSAALGDAAEWEAENSVPPLLGGIDYFKLGTASLRTGTGWAARFAAVQHRLGADNSPRLSKGGLGGVALPATSVVAGLPTEPLTMTASLPRGWIIVAYADWQIANAPEPEHVIADAFKCGCSGVLIDTFSKGDRRLIDWLPVERLNSLARLARSAGLTFALAGRLKLADVPELCAIRPDIVGIRSAACRAGIRTAEIDPDAVRAFRDALVACPSLVLNR